MEPFIHDKHVRQRGINPCLLETTNSLKQAMNPAYFIVRLQVYNKRYLPLSMA